MHSKLYQVNRKVKFVDSDMRELAPKVKENLDLGYLTRKVKDESDLKLPPH